MLFLLALTLARTAAKSRGVEYSRTPVIVILGAATYTVNYTPMLAIRLLA